MTFVSGQKVKCDFEYGDDLVLLIADPGKFQVYLDLLNESIGVFRMRFTLSNCKMPLHD